MVNYLMADKSWHCYCFDSLSFDAGTGWPQDWPAAGQDSAHAGKAAAAAADLAKVCGTAAGHVAPSRAAAEVAAAAFGSCSVGCHPENK